MGIFAWSAFFDSVVIDILPTLALCSRHANPDRETIRTWTLVLSARRILCRVEDGPRLLVAPALGPRAVFEIVQYETENASCIRPVPLPENAWVSVFVLTVFAAAITWIDAREWALRQTMDLAGRADAALILDGEWWRCVTALMLHADAGHLLSNIGTLLVLAPLVARRLGSGLCWLFFLSSGALGNAANAWMQAPHHVSVGASTGVFGLVGVLAAGAVWAESGHRRPGILASVGFGLGFLALLGMGEGRIDIGAHVFGLLAGGLLGGCPWVWRGGPWRPLASVAAGVCCVVLVVWAWRCAFAG